MVAPVPVLVLLGKHGLCFLSSLLICLILLAHDEGSHDRLIVCCVVVFIFIYIRHVLKLRANGLVDVEQLIDNLLVAFEPLMLEGLRGSWPFLGVLLEHQEEQVLPLLRNGL